jgi:hypothetical protein
MKPEIVVFFALATFVDGILHSGQEVRYRDCWLSNRQPHTMESVNLFDARFVER